VPEPQKIRIPTLARCPGRYTDIAICAALYVIIVVSGVLTEGNGTDDWLQIDEPFNEWVPHYGRWVTDLISRWFFHGHYLLPLQLVVAFVAFVYVARTVAGHVVECAWQPCATALLFALGVTHLYMTEMLSFSSHIMGYALAIAASVAAFDLLAPDHPTCWPAWVRVIVAAQQLAFSLGSYQTFALAGGIIAMAVLMRADRHDSRQVGRYWPLGALATVLALALYAGELFIYVWALDFGSLNMDYEGAPMTLAERLRTLPNVLLQLHTLNASAGLPRPVRLLNLLFFVALLALGGLIVLRLARKGRFDAASRVAVGAALAFFVLPILFVPITKSYIAGRAFAYIGFFYGGVLLAAVTTAQRIAGRPAPDWLSRASALLLVAMALTYGAITMRVWDDRARIDARDRALAATMMARVSALPGYQGGAFHIYGWKRYPDLAWGNVLGLSIFVGDWGDYSIFKELYGIGPVPTGVVASPRACPAFPAEQSVFMDNGAAFVCLEASAVP